MQTSIDDVLKSFAIGAMQTALLLTNGSCTRSAKALGIERTTFIERCKRFGISPEDYRDSYDEIAPADLRITDFALRPKCLAGNATGLRSRLLQIVIETLIKHNYNRTTAARELSISLRAMRDYIAELKTSGLNIPDNPERGGRQSK